MTLLGDFPLRAMTPMKVFGVLYLTAYTLMGGPYGLTIVFSIGLWRLARTIRQVT